MFEQGLLLGVRGDKANSALIGIFLDQITCDGARLVEDEAIIILAMATSSRVSACAELGVIQRTM